MPCNVFIPKRQVSLCGPLFHGRSLDLHPLNSIRIQLFLSLRSLVTVNFVGTTLYIIEQIGVLPEISYIKDRIRKITLGSAAFFEDRFCTARLKSSSSSPITSSDGFPALPLPFPSSAADAPSVSEAVSVETSAVPPAEALSPVAPVPTVPFPALQPASTMDTQMMIDRSLFMSHSPLCLIA